MILDVDGTLIDSNDAHAHAWVEAFAEGGITVAWAGVRRAIGMGGDKLMPLVAGIEEDSPRGESIAERRGEIFRTTWLPTLEPFPGVRDLLQRFLDEGFTLAVATSASTKDLNLLLQAAGIRDLIAEQTSSDDAEHSKPDPDIVAAALRKAGVEPALAVMLGDTPYDVEAAHRAGIEVVGFECGGWARQELPAEEVYADASDLLRRYDRSLFARLSAAAQA